jgi:hypothetical protein
MLTGNYKTTIAGVTAILSGLPALLKCFAGGLDFACLSMAIGPIIVGIGLLLAKDHDVTGGSRANGGGA